MQNICLFCGLHSLPGLLTMILSILHCVSLAKITRPRGSYIFRAGDSTEVMGLCVVRSTRPARYRRIFGDTVSCPSAIPETFSANLTPPPPVPS